MRKKIILFFIYDGFPDHEFSYLLHSINKKNPGTIKTMSLNKNIVKSGSGFSIVPDLDFIPHIDLADIEEEGVAMLILPDAAYANKHRELKALINHCINHNIPVLTEKNIEGENELNPSPHLPYSFRIKESLVAAS